VLEVNAGIGNLSGRLMARRILYVAAEKDPLHLHALRNRFLRTPNVVVKRIDPEAPQDLASMVACFDTVLCLNVLEYLDDPAAVLRSLSATLKPGGRVVALMPHSPALFGSLDRSMGHKRRYSAEAAQQLLEAQGFAVERVEDFNKAGAPTWWIFGRVAGRRRINKLVLKIFDKTVWIWRRLDRLMPWPGLSLIVAGRKTGVTPDATPEAVQDATPEAAQDAAPSDAQAAILSRYPS
jgi:SAM-dependent methyltransferase